MALPQLLAPRLYPLVIGGELVAPSAEVSVRSPFSGDEVGRCGEATVRVHRTAPSGRGGRSRYMTGQPCP